MRLRHKLASLGVVAGFALVATSVAAGDVPRMGDQHVGIFACAFAPPCGEIWLAADEPFYVAHGFTSEPKADLLDPQHRFELYVDGDQRHGAIDLDLSGIGEKWYVFNFAQGMTGTHAFTGCWYATGGAVLACGTRIVHFV